MDSLILGLRVLVSLAAVFGLMWLLHRRLRAGNPGLRARLLSVVARQNVGPKAAVVLVDTDGKRFLLGVTEQGINVLHTTDLPEPEGIPEAAPAPGRTTPTDVPDPDRDAEISFDAELRRHRRRVDEHARRPGSIVEPATWRLAAEAFRSGRRP